jgi:hypothetical protein
MQQRRLTNKVIGHHLANCEVTIMSFNNYKSLGETVKEFQITYAEAHFVQEVTFAVADYFRQDFTWTIEEGAVDNSALAICQNLIYPILKEVWKGYRSQLQLWTQQYLNCDATLPGFPQYILAGRSPLGKVVFDKPYFLLVEAKQDNFDAGWGQCLSEMIAAQKLNEEANVTIFGIVSNGSIWQFGKLEASLFTKHTFPYTIFDLDKLFAAVNYIFQQCEAQLNDLIAA